MVDFTPKGGPKDLKGTWDGDGIRKCTTFLIRFLLLTIFIMLPLFLLINIIFKDGLMVTSGH